MKRVIVTSILSFVLLFAFGMVAYGETNKVKLTGTELQWLISESNGVTFGINHKFKSVWIIVGHGNGKRDIYWRSLVNPGLWMMQTGTARIDGDYFCSKWSNPGSQERCYDVYRIGEDKYESWLSGSLVATWFRGQTEYKEPKKKVKLTGAELQELFYKKPGVFAGIGHRTNSVWILWAEGDKREVYWRSLTIPGWSGSDTTTARIEGDKTCLKWTWGPERCLDIYRIGEDKYESWLSGSLVSTWFRGQTEYKEPKKKVKLTGAEIQELFFKKPGVAAGIDHRNKSVWILWAEGDKREVYWRSLAIPGWSGSDTTTARIEGNKPCMKWTWGPERCPDIYRIGEDKYESRLNGNLENIYYKLK